MNFESTKNLVTVSNCSTFVGYIILTKQKHTVQYIRIFSPRRNTLLYSS